MIFLLAGVPVEPDRVQGQRWAITELSRREYQEARPGLIERLLVWGRDQLDRIDLGHNPPAKLALTVLVLVVAAVVTYAVYRAGGFGTQARRRSAEVLPTRATTAADHRASADRHASAGEWDDAVRERFRAIARELEERAILSPQPGRTALEVANLAGRELPALSTGLVAGARLFDDVSYGSVPMHEVDDASLRALDSHLRAARVTTLS